MPASGFWGAETEPLVLSPSGLVEGLPRGCKISGLWHNMKQSNHAATREASHKAIRAQRTDASGLLEEETRNPVGGPPRDWLAMLPVRHHHIFLRGTSRVKNRYALDEKSAPDRYFIAALLKSLAASREASREAVRL